MSKNGVLAWEWGWYGPIPEEDAMKTLSRFVAKFTGLFDASTIDAVTGLNGYLHPSFLRPPSFL